MDKFERKTEEYKCKWYDRIFLAIPFIGIIYGMITLRPHHSSKEFSFWMIYQTIIIGIYLYFLKLIEIN